MTSSYHSLQAQNNLTESLEGLKKLFLYMKTMISPQAQYVMAKYPLKLRSHVIKPIKRALLLKQWKG